LNFLRTKVLVTGATGFVGSAFLARTASDGQFLLRAVLRREVQGLPSEIETVFVEGLTAATVWIAALQDIDVVVHAAARVHVMQDTSTDPLTEFRRVNVEGTLNLARQAATAGVKRFIFISSIKVNGEVTLLDKPFVSDDPPAPIDPYGISKLEAEQGLQLLAKKTGLEVVIIRPPLVYGPGVKANFAAMLKWLDKGVPLPFGAIQNRRSLIALDNLIDFILTCIEHPQAANQIFLVSDGEDVSTAELLRKTANAMGKKSLLLPVPVGAMRFMAKLLGKEAVADRLFGSLQVDISKARNLLGWIPPISVDEGLRRTVLGLKKIE
jgi:nucleoside-diphosphate-sugar epimerase